ncbi:MAG: PDZ domain-containing protein [Lachnospiraceae bacterium]|nr:PDZ domain-containing protein [Lachnospiraceae bacterium]
MADLNEQDFQNKPKDGTGSDDEYYFIKETRKKKPEDRQVWIRRILITAVMAAGAGLLAALLFAVSVPWFQKLLGSSLNGSEKVEIAGISSSSEEESEEELSEGAENGEEVIEDAEHTSDENAGEAVKEPAEEEEHFLEDYSRIYQEMAAVAENVECSMVEVIGVTGNLDYFNHDYENRQSLSGLLVAESSSSLYCLAENRSLKKADSIQVIFCDGERVNAEFVTSDPETDLAVLSISRSEIGDSTWNTIRTASLGNYSTLQQGTPIIALGSIHGLGDSLEYGFVTSSDHTISFWDVNYNVIVTDMAGSSSGSGCLVNLQGEVVGFLNQNISSGECQLVTAIPVKQLSSLIEDLINEVPQIRIGIKGQTVTEAISDSAGIPRGVLVTEVEQESPAMYAGLKELDVITAVNGEELKSFRDYRRVIAALQEGAEVQVDAMRMGKETYESITFRLKPETK